MRMHFVGLLLLCSPLALRAAPLDPCLPDDATLVLAVNVRQVLDAPLTKQLLPQGVTSYFQDLPGVREISQALTLDPARDVATLLYAGPVPPRADRGLLVLRGKFDLPKRHAAARAWADQHPDRLQIARLGDRLIYQWKEGSAPTACFLDDTTLLLSPARSQVEECIARHDGKKPVQVSPEMKALLEKADARQSVWLAVLATDELKKQLATTPETAKLFDSVVSFSGGITIGDGFQTAGVLLTRDGKAAGELRKFVDGVKAILSLAAADSKDSPALRAALIAAVKVISANQAVTLHGMLTKEQIDRLPRMP